MFYIILTDQANVEFKCGIRSHIARTPLIFDIQPTECYMIIARSAVMADLNQQGKDYRTPCRSYGRKEDLSKVLWHHILDAYILNPQNLARHQPEQINP